MISRYKETPELPKMDARGRKILAILAMDARQTDAQIAKRARTSREVTRYRLLRMEETGVLQQIVPIINTQALGWQRFHLFLLLDGRQRRTAELIHWLTNHAHTAALMEFTDTWDLRWTVLARSMREYDGIVRELQSSFGDAILDKQDLAGIAEYCSSPLPLCFGPTVLAQLQAKEESPTQLNKQDQIILTQLATNGRMSSYQIAQSTSVSNDTVLLRIRKMRESRVIERITVACNLAALGFHWYTLSLQFSRFTEADEYHLREFVHQHPHIIHAERTFGPWDVILEIIADAGAFHKTVKEIKNAFAGFIRKYETWVAYREHTYVPLPACVVK